jgi:competence protein ComEC
LFLTLGQIAGWLPVWLPTAVPLWAWLLGMAGALIVLLPAGVPWRGLGVLLMLPLFYPPLSAPTSGEAEVWQWDVGQGLAVLVRTQNHNLLYDAGPKHADFDLGERVVLPALRGLGVNKLDLMLLSHADMDHAGGALALARGLPIAQVLSGEVAELPGSLTAQPCIDGAHWRWDGVHFSTWRWQAASAGNSSSCVLLVEAQSGERLLLTGDIDKTAERALLERVADLRADWLQAPHHGSLSSSSMVFLRAVAPRAVLISRGRLNTYGHPHPRVLARYQALGAQVYDNVPSGALRIQLGRHAPAQGWREQRRFWR